MLKEGCLVGPGVDTGGRQVFPECAKAGRESGR